MPPQRAGASWLSRAFLVAALGYVAAALLAALVLTPRVPYADSWAHYLRLLTTPFPASVLYAENGHAEWFANAVRLVSLRAFGGSENVQIAIGLALALATWAVLVGTVRRVVGATALQRAAATLAISLGIFWLGNARALLHDNETLHVYSVLLCVAVAIRSLTRAAPDPARVLRDVVVAVAASALATFNFGSGVAAFVAVLAILVMQRAGWRAFLVVALGFASTMVVYRALPGSDGVPLAIAPWPQFVLASRSLASPLIYLLWPLLDPHVTAHLPAPLAAFGDFARAWTRVFGDVMNSTAPQASVGIAFLAVLCWQTWQARTSVAQGQHLASGVHCGLGLAWFGVGVAALIALTRLDYFAAFPDQVYAPRYLPWSSLAWAGLLVAVIARRGTTRVTIVALAVIAIAALAAEVGMTLTMRHAREVAYDTALAAVAGIWPDDDRPGETDSGVTAQASAAMRAARIGPFAWPEAALINEPLPANAKEVAVTALHSAAVVNRINRGAVRVTMTLAALPCAMSRALLGESGRVVGLARRVDRTTWRGAAMREDASALGVWIVCTP